MSYGKLDNEINYLKQKHTKSYKTKNEIQINLHMANLLSIFKLSSNITDIFHPHSEKPASG